MCARSLQAKTMSRGSSYIMSEYYTPPLQLGRLGSGKSLRVGVAAGVGKSLGLSAYCTAR